MAKKSIFVVDDEPDFLEMVQEILIDDFDITTMTTGQEAFDKFEAAQPDIILLDIGLPDIDGYQVCQEIKKQDLEDSVSIIFISGRDSLNERLTGYNAGADDYIVKPVELAELLAKVQTINKFQRGKETLKQQELLSRNMAFQAMTEASQYGSVLQFFKKAALCSNCDEIAKEIVEVCNEFTLNCGVQIRGEGALTLRSSGGECSPMEYQLFELLSQRGRIYTYNQRVMFNAGDISILVTNMPTEDEVRSGRLVDLLAAIVEAAQSALINLARLNTLKTLLDTTQSTLATISKSYSEQKEETVTVIDRMTIDMEAAIVKMGMTEQQEEYFVNLAEVTLRTLLKQHDEDYIIEQSLSDIVADIQKYVGD